MALSTLVLCFGLLNVAEAATEGVKYEIMPFQEDNGTAWRKRLGIIILDVDEVIEEEFPKIMDLPNGVVLYHARMGKGPKVTKDDLNGLIKGVPSVSALLPPFPFSVIGFACTSAAVEIGETKLGELVAAGLERVGGDIHADHVTNPLTAAKRALKHLGAKKVAVLTPYTEDITENEVASFMKAGFSVDRVGYFNRTYDKMIVRIEPKSVLAAVVELARSDKPDAIFVSCTNVRILPILRQAEALTGIPVLSSNTAMAWDMLRIAGLLKADSQLQALYGSIFSSRYAAVSAAKPTGYITV